MSAPPTFLSLLYARKLSAFAGQSLLIYDYLLTFSLEVTYIWNAPWTLVKTLFLINRYGNLIGQTFIMLEETGSLIRISQRFCRGFGLGCFVFGVFSGESIRLLVVMRACAILRCRRSILTLFNALYILYAIGLFVLAAYFPGAPNPPVYEFLDEISVCFTKLTSNMWTIYLIPLSFDCLVFVIVCYNLWELSGGGQGAYPSRLIRLLARDALLFYFAALFNVFFSILCWRVYDQDPRSFIQTLISYPFLSVIGQRVVLNLRRFRAQQDSTRELSKEIDRQIAAMGDGLSYPSRNVGVVADQLALEHISIWEGA